MSKRSPGFEEYTPSRLEWLVVLLNSYIHYINTRPSERIEYLYTLAGDGNTITMHMRHYNDLEQEWVERYADVGKNFAINTAKRYNWDSWINIQIEFDPIDRPKQNNENVPL